MKVVVYEVRKSTTTSEDDDRVHLATGSQWISPTTKRVSRAHARGTAQLFGEEILEKAKKQIYIAKETGKPMTPMEALHFVGKMKERQDQKEYEKILEENNNNNHS